MKVLISIAVIAVVWITRDMVVGYKRKKRELDREPERLKKGDEVVLCMEMYDLKDAVVLHQIKSRVTVRILERDEFGKMVTVDRRYCKKIRG